MLLLKILSKLPLRLLYISVKFIFLIFPYRNKVVKVNLKIAFPQLSDKQHRVIKKNFYQYFSEFIAENIKDLDLYFNISKNNISIKNLHLFDLYLKENRKIMLMLGHHGNFEHLSIIPNLIQQNVYAVYGEIKNKKIEKLILQKRGKYGLRLFPMKDTYKYIENNSDESAVYGFIADQSPHEGKIHHRSKFFAEGTPTHVGAEKLAKLYDMVVIYLECKRISRGKYEFTPIVITENPRQLPNFEITDTYNKLLEESIKKQPEIYLWTHKRWKHLNNRVYS